MGRFDREPGTPAKSSKPRGSNLRTHFKSNCGTVKAIRKMPLKRAVSFLQKKQKKSASSARRSNGNGGGFSLTPDFGAVQGRFGNKSAQFFLQVLNDVENSVANSTVDDDKVLIGQIQINSISDLRRLTHRSRGRLNPRRKSPTHIELLLTEGENGPELVQMGQRPSANKPRRNVAA